MAEVRKPDNQCMVGFRHVRKCPKIFCIGFHKTGTTSLATALQMLGLVVTGPNCHRDPDVARTFHSKVEPLVRGHDAFVDNPWPILFDSLDRRYPGARFILTLRSPTDWIESVVRHFGSTTTPMREWIYGVGAGAPLGNERLYVERYERHLEAVRRHFRHRNDDLLTLDIVGGEGWARLCPFLGKPVPNGSFPIRNAARDRERDSRRRGASLTNRLSSFGRWCRLRSPSTPDRDGEG